ALRRAATPRHDSREPEPIAVNGLTIDPARRTVDAGGEPVQLTYVEFELLRSLASRPGRVFTRQALLEAVWGGSDYRDPRTIDVHIRHLREKLERDAAATVDARVVVFNYFSTEPSLTLAVQQDSRGLTPSNDVANDAVALRAATSGNLEHGTVLRRGSRYAEVAFVTPDNDIVLVSSSLGDTLGAVSVARQRLLIAGGIVLALVLFVGYFAAWLFTRRIRNLERAAERISS